MGRNSSLVIQQLFLLYVYFRRTQFYFFLYVCCMLMGVDVRGIIILCLDQVVRINEANQGPVAKQHKLLPHTVILRLSSLDFHIILFFEIIICLLIIFYLGYPPLVCIIIRACRHCHLLATQLGVFMVSFKIREIIHTST